MADGWCSQTLVRRKFISSHTEGDTGARYLKLTPAVVWIFKFNGEWVLLAALHLCKSFVMWLRGDNCTLNILFVLQLVLTRWPPIYDPVFRCTLCTVSTVMYSGWDRCLSQPRTPDLCRSLQRSPLRDKQLICDDFKMISTVIMTCDPWSMRHPSWVISPRITHGPLHLKCEIK